MQPQNQVLDISGHLQNLRVSISDSGVGVKGSLAKFYLNDNLQQLTRQDSQRAIELLSDTLQVPVSRAIVSRLDVAHNIMLDHPISSFCLFN